MTAPLIFIVDDDDSIRFILSRALTQAGFVTEEFADPEALHMRLTAQTPALLLTDINMPTGHSKTKGKTAGLVLLDEFKNRYPDIPVIIMTAYSDLDNTVAAFHGGAFEYLTKPFELTHVISTVKRALEHHQRNTIPNRAAINLHPRAGLLGRAPAMQDIFRAIGRLSQSSASVLITGESGTGKELVARALHQHSPRSGQAFVAINTAAIAKDLLESELFGHEKGAFTGAHTQRKGVFETAHGGTLFLDEIGDMPLALQTRLLRVLSQGEFYRVGGANLIKTDVRIIAATHQDLDAQVKTGIFRIDLLHRLKVISIHLPPLRARTDDIPELAQHFLFQHARQLGVISKVLSPQALERLQAFSFPGNVRQLDNLCHWLSVMAPSTVVDVNDLPPEITALNELIESIESIAPVPSIEKSVEKTAVETPRQGTQENSTTTWTELLRHDIHERLKDSSPKDMKLDYANLLQQFELTILHEVLHHTRNNRQVAAQILGWGRNTVSRKLQDAPTVSDQES